MLANHAVKRPHSCLYAWQGSARTICQSGKQWSPTHACRTSMVGGHLLSFQLPCVSSSSLPSITVEKYNWQLKLRKLKILINFRSRSQMLPNTMTRKACDSFPRLIELVTCQSHSASVQAGLLLSLECLSITAGMHQGRLLARLMICVALWSICWSICTSQR